MLVSNSTTRQAIERALQNVIDARTHQTPCQQEAAAASQALDGSADDIQAIQFDRPDKDVSSSGRSLRAKACNAISHEQGGKAHQEAISSTSAQIEENLNTALGSVGSNGQARWHLEEAARSLDFMKSHDLTALESDLRVGARRLGPQLNPYLSEVEADAPGRDVGRFAADIKQLVADGNLFFKEAGLATNWIAGDLNQIETELKLARQSLG